MIKVDQSYSKNYEEVTVKMNFKFYAALTIFLSHGIIFSEVNAFRIDITGEFICKTSEVNAINKINFVKIFLNILQKKLQENYKNFNIQKPAAMKVLSTFCME